MKYKERPTGFVQANEGKGLGHMLKWSTGLLKKAIDDIELPSFKKNWAWYFVRVGMFLMILGSAFAPTINSSFSWLIGVGGILTAFGLMKKGWRTIRV